MKSKTINVLGFLSVGLLFVLLVLFTIYGLIRGWSKEYIWGALIILGLSGAAYLNLNAAWNVYLGRQKWK